MERQKPIIIANWKMNLTLKESVFLAKKIKKLSALKNVQLIVCPSFTALAAVSQVTKRSEIKLGGQNCSWQDRGAVTGEISPLMLKELGCHYVILGHSERKKYFLEDCQLVNRKVKAALAESLVPIICLGEQWEERQEGRATTVIEQQTKEILAGLHDLGNKKIILSYEPFWAISSSAGRIATSEEVEEGLRAIEQAVVDLFGNTISQKHLILVYGGTVEEESVDDFLKIDGLAGFLVGRASLQIESLKKLIEKF